VLLALLRIDLAQRRRRGNALPLEWYRGEYLELDNEGLVALIYEEFCLREEEQDWPDPGEYERRFPALASQVREVLDIHDLVGSAQSSTTDGLSEAGPAFPESGQTIAGFRLVEEVGRGSFARVFLAQDRTLADRLVALKITRPGTREPQTLARLQHTHIVPIYSHGTDPVSGLHVLCMPYFGRVTLAALLAEPDTRLCRTGAELVRVLERLQRSASDWGPRVAREALACRSYPRAIAWWGARLAEGLQHAHDRGILHRDIKPSNVLISGDGLPMLLDFNLADDRRPGSPDPARLGGTLAYMAPEHLIAVAQRRPECVDHRGDLYALGVVLFEALGARPFAGASGAALGTDALLQAAEKRREGPLRLRSLNAAVPVELETVLRRCLTAEPHERYPSASALAADLQAVADDAPLRVAREPMANRVLRSLRRNRRRLLIAVPSALIVTALLTTLGAVEAERARVKGQIKQWIADGEAARREENYLVAQTQFSAALRLAHGRAGFESLRAAAEAGRARSTEAIATQKQIDDFLRESEPLKFTFLGFGGDAASASRRLTELLKPFAVLDEAEWFRRGGLASLQSASKQRLLTAANEMLFLWVIASDVPGDAEMARRAVAQCDLALAFAEPKATWRALRARYDPAGGHINDPLQELSEENGARGWFQWALLARLEGDRARTVAALERAVARNTRDYWSLLALGYYRHLEGQTDRAIALYDQAIALRPNAPWARLNRAQVLWRYRGAYERARIDLASALENANGWPMIEVLRELGALNQSVGAFPEARKAFAQVIAREPGGTTADLAGLDLARLEADAGRFGRARSVYNELLSRDSRNTAALLGRARLSLRIGRAPAAEADLDALLRLPMENSLMAEALADRALTRIWLGRNREAEADAKAALECGSTSRLARVLCRTQLALRSEVDVRSLSPEEIAGLPLGGKALRADLRAVAEHLRPACERDGPEGLAAVRNRALILAALGEGEALVEAEKAVERAPLAAASYALRARIRRSQGLRDEALDDTNRGLALEPNHPELLGFRGRLYRDAGDLRRALADLDEALRNGASAGAVHETRAEVRRSSGDMKGEISDWSAALEADPDDVRAYIGRARCFARLRHWDQAFADLEKAAARTDAGSALMPELTLTYAACAVLRPDRGERVLALARRWLERRS
jgi:serine/threonine protein kinase/tetratricopeptide (TPR) repeat protein